MDKQDPDSGSPEQRAAIFTPQGESCEKCGSKDDVQKFDGSKLCKACRNQYAEMRM
jgi:hypothetical protein